MKFWITNDIFRSVYCQHSGGGRRSGRRGALAACRRASHFLNAFKRVKWPRVVIVTDVHGMRVDPAAPDTKSSVRPVAAKILGIADNDTRTPDRPPVCLITVLLHPAVFCEVFAEATNRCATIEATIP